jgi:predicted peroxiredoxin
MVIINLATGHEDAERVTVAFLVAVAALEKGKQVTMFLTKEAVRIGLPGYADAIETAGAPPVSRLFAQFAEKGGELWSARSASKPASSTPTRSWTTRALAGRRRCGS